MYIIKNTTLSNISLKEIGRLIPSSSSITINIQDYLLLSAEESVTELTPYINSGDIVINDGNNDLTPSVALNWILYPNEAKNILFNSTNSELIGNTVQETLEGISQGNGIPSLDRMIYVAKNGNNETANGSFNKPFLTVKAAIDYTVANLNPTSNNGISIEIAAGQFNEDPFTIPQWVLLRGCSTKTIINANNPNANLITLSINSCIRNLSVSGINNLNSYLIYVNTSNSGNSSISDLFITNSLNGIYFNCTSGEYNCTINNLLSNEITGHIITVLDNCRITINNSSIIGNNSTTNAFENNGNSSLFINNAKIDNCLHAVHCSGSNSETEIFNLEAQTCIVPIKQENSARIIISSGNFDVRNASLNDLSTIEGIFLNEVPEENRLTVLSELSVGTAGLGKQSTFGGGDSYQNGLLVYTYNGSTYTNVSADAKTGTGTTFTFPGTTTGNSILVSSTFPIFEGTTHQFSGIKHRCLTAAVLGAGEIVAEYWDGNAWVEFSHMSQAGSTDNHIKYGKNIFTRINDEQVYFNNNILTDWVRNDPMSLGTVYYWIRFKIASNITTAPIFDSFKIHTDRTQIQEDGFISYFGRARRLKQLSNDIRFVGSINSPNNQDVFLSDNLSVGKNENEFFSSGSLSNNDQAGAVFRLPEDTDTSTPITLNIKYLSSDTGTLRFTVYWSPSRDGDTIYQSSGSAPSIGTREQSISVIDSYSVDDIQKTVEVQLDVSEFQPRSENLEADLVWISIKMDSNTTVKPMTIVNFSCDYVSNESGGHLI